VKDIKNDVLKVGTLGNIARSQLMGDDVKAAQKALAAVLALRDNTKDDTVRLNATLTADGMLVSIAATQARLGKIKDAFKTANKIGSHGREVIALGYIAREQAKRKDFVGALKTIEKTESTLIPRMLFDVAMIQEKIDKPGAATTWKLCVKALQKLEPSEEQD